MKPDEDLRTAKGLVVPSSALQWNFSRSGGAGGQHVNKTSSKATLVIKTEDIVGTEILLKRVKIKLTKTVRVTSQTSRSQWRNRQLCLEQLTEIIDNAARPDNPKRRKSKPTRGSIERRLESKRRIGKKKESRQTDDW